MTKFAILAVLSAIWTSFSAAQTTHFHFFSNTGNNATIAIPDSAHPNIGGIALQPGDEIGVFANGYVTTDSFCVGAVIWNGVNTAITVWGDNDQTEALDGIRAGTAMHFRIWKESSNTEYSDVTVKYSEGNGVYEPNGLYALSSITASALQSVPAPISPEGDSIVSPNKVVLKWRSLSGADAYHVQLSTDSSFKVLTVDDSTVVDTSFIVSALNAGTKYYWRVSANFGGAFETYSRVADFRTSSIVLSVGTVTGMPGDTVNVPVDVVFPQDSSFNSLQMLIKGFEGKMRFLGLADSGMICRAGWLLEYNDTDSLFITASAGANNISGSGMLMQLKFLIPIAADTGLIPVEPISCLFNTGRDSVGLVGGGVRVASRFVYGDVDMNGIVQAYDASLILKYLVGRISLNHNQIMRAEVSGDTGVSALDASLILKYVTGLIDSLPYTVNTPSLIASGRVVMDTVKVQASDTAEIPILIAGGKNILSFYGRLSYDPLAMKFSGYSNPGEVSGLYADTDMTNGTVEFAGASSEYIAGNGSIGTLKFVLDSAWARASDAPVSVSLESLRWNAGPVQTNVAKSVIIFVPTGVKNAGLDVPSEFILDQNYPNPFNPTTKIRYGLPHRAKVELDVYNVLGERVETLVNGEQSAGYHVATFAGTGLPSGVYFCRIDAGEFVKIEKMAMIK